MATQEEEERETKARVEILIIGSFDYWQNVERRVVVSEPVVLCCNWLMGMHLAWARFMRAWQ